MFSIPSAQAWSPTRSFWVLLALLAIGFALLGQGGGAHGQASQAHFALNASGSGVMCDAPLEPTQCSVPTGGTFTLAVEMVHPPADGYIAIQTQLYVGALTWIPRSAAEENVWPDNALPVRSPNPPTPGTILVIHGGLTSLSAPFTPSHYEGNVVAIDLTCAQEPTATDIALIDYGPDTPLGTTFSLPDRSTVASPPVGTVEIDWNGSGTPQRIPVASILTVRCGGAVAPPAGASLPGYETAPNPAQDGGALGATADSGTPQQTSGTPRAAGTAVSPTPAAGSAGKKSNGGGPPWAVIGAVIAVAAVATAGAGFWWYSRGRSA